MPPPATEPGIYERWQDLQSLSEMRGAATVFMGDNDRGAKWQAGEEAGAARNSLGPVRPALPGTSE